MQAPDLNKSKDDATTNIYNALTATQLVGCIYCAMMGNVENPAVIYHHQGTTYCLDHLMGVLSTAQSGVL